MAKRSRGTPRVANRLLKIVRDYLIVHPDVSTDFSAIFTDLGIDAHGLDTLDRNILSHIQNTFSGGPVGLGTLASVIGEEEKTVEEVIEPYLLKIGFLERTPRGRKITTTGEQYLHTNTT